MVRSQIKSLASALANFVMALRHFAVLLVGWVNSEFIVVLSNESQVALSELAQVDLAYVIVDHELQLCFLSLLLGSQLLELFLRKLALLLHEFDLLFGLSLLLLASLFPLFLPLLELAHVLFLPPLLFPFDQFLANVFSKADAKVDLQFLFLVVRNIVRLFREVVSLQILLSWFVF